MEAGPQLDDLAGEQAYAAQHGLRSEGDVVWVPALEGWLVLTRDAAIMALRDSGTFTVDDERFSTAVVVGTSMLSTDGAEHARHRRPFVAPFLRTEIDRHLASRVAAIADRLVADLAPLGRAELRTQLAGPLAVETIIDALALVDVQAVEPIDAGRPTGLIFRKPDRVDISWTPAREAAGSVSRVQGK